MTWATKTVDGTLLCKHLLLSFLYHTVSLLYTLSYKASISRLYPRGSRGERTFPLSWLWRYMRMRRGTFTRVMMKGPLATVPRWYRTSRRTDDRMGVTGRRFLSLSGGKKQQHEGTLVPESSRRTVGHKGQSKELYKNCGPKGQSKEL